MKLFHVSILLIALTAQGAPSQNIVATQNDTTEDGEVPREETVQISHVFAPGGIRANEEAIVIATGWLPSPCFHSPKGIVTRVGTSITVSVQATTEISPDTMCITLAVPYLIQVRLGKLSAGNYSIMYDRNDVTMQTTLTIDSLRSTNEYLPLYARVENISFDEKKHQLKLSGRNPSDCMALERISIVSNGSDTYTISPIMKKIYQECPKKLVPFEYRINVSKELDNVLVLFHVRTINAETNFINFLQGPSLF